ncbi:MAG: T9SS type A sorting domain-containing protein [Bacteroidota bacterium]
MKRILSFSLTLFLFFAFLGVENPEVKACDRTFTQLDSVVFTGGLYTIYTTVCIGGGLTGINTGAGGDTREIAFGFFSSTIDTINIITFSPMIITGDSTGCSWFGFDFMPQGAPFNSQATVGFIDLFGCATGYQCINSTMLCGQAHAQCTQFTFTVDALPDSARVFGPEGAGNPVAGCYPDPDMLLDFTILPVEWGDLYGAVVENGINLDWSTLSETNNDYFDVMRSADGVNFESIGTVTAQGSSQRLISYGFLDDQPIIGTSHYKIIQVDLDGSRSESETVTLEYTVPSGLRWGDIGPVPASDFVNLSFSTEFAESLQLAVYDVKGSQVLTRTIDAQIGTNTMHLNLEDLEAGIYYLQLKGPSGRLDHKLMKF